MPGAPIPDGDCGVVECARFKWEVLCDSGTAPATSFLRCYLIDCVSGEVIATTDTELDGFTPYAVIGDVGVCAGDVNIPPTNVVDAELVCFDAGPSPLVRVTVYDPQTGDLVAGPFWRDPLTGAPVVPAGTPIPCPDAEVDVEIKCLCDDGTSPPTPFLRVFTYVDGVNTDVSDVELDGVTPYVLVGDAIFCSSGGAGSCELLCDAGNADFPFIRCYSIDASGGVVVTDVEVDGTPYVAVGPVGDCPCPECVDTESFVLCDDDTDPPTPFLRRYDTTSSGSVTTVDTELDGTTPYVVAGAAIVCPVDIDMGTVNVEAPDTSNGESIRSGFDRISGAGSTWSVGVDTVGRVQSVTFIINNRTGVFIGDDFGNLIAVPNNFDTYEWGIEALNSELEPTLSVAITAAAGDVTILWTEVA